MTLNVQFGLWQTVVFEYPNRIPYLDVLIHLDAADAVFILGSTEPHYTPSKAYQAVLSKKPIIAVLHEQSTVVNILRETNAGKLLSFNGEEGISEIKQTFSSLFKDFISFKDSFHQESVDQAAFKKFSAANVTHQLVQLIDQAIKNV